MQSWIVFVYYQFSTIRLIIQRKRSNCQNSYLSSFQFLPADYKKYTKRRWDSATNFYYYLSDIHQCTWHRRSVSSLKLYYVFLSCFSFQCFERGMEFLKCVEWAAYQIKNTPVPMLVCAPCDKNYKFSICNGCSISSQNRKRNVS